MKTLITDRSRAQEHVAGSSDAPQTWEDFARLYPIYEALTRKLNLPGGPYPSGVRAGSWSNNKNRERDLLWLDQVDQQLQAVHLRQFLATPAVAREDSLGLFLQRQLGKPEKLPADRDKIDLLLVQYFVLCAPQDLIAGRIETSDVARILQPVLGEVETKSFDRCEPFDCILEAAQQCRSLRDLMGQGLLEQGKRVKAAVGDMFYESAALVSICRFNFLLRRTFIQRLHADLRAVGAALAQLEKRGFKAVDCRGAGFSSREPISKLQQFHQHWKPPFQNDYNQDSSFQAYEQLMCLREDLEDALGPAVAHNGPTSITAVKIEVGRDAQAIAESPLHSDGSKGVAPAAPCAVSSASSSSAKHQDPGEATARSNSPLSDAAQASEQTLPNIGVADVENLEEKIWEQLIATPPVRGRSMTTVTVENTRILLSAWEVAAFISDSGQDSEELRRLIVARAMLSTSIERRKRLMDFKVLQQALAHARGEIPRFQERVDQLKRTMKTDGAVNLGISLKRLLSLVEEAEQLQKRNEQKQENR